MQNDCEIYVDPEEDEVFFGCVSEREKSISSKLLKFAGSKDSKLNKVSDDVINLEEENIENALNNEQSTESSKEAVINESESIPQKDLENSFEKSDDSITILPNNSSAELDHSYSTPMKNKIDKTILATPKSVVKADKDGGFLKVLSEIALVKAEAEGIKESAEKKEDEDKENKIMQSVPEIKITEATPEKGSVLSPPKSINTEIRRFRIIYNSPQNEDNIDHKSKSHSDTFESERNLRNKCFDQESEKTVSSEKRKSVDLIDFNESNVLSQGISMEGGETKNLTEGKVESKETDNSNNQCDCDEVVILKEEKAVILIQEKPSSTESEEPTNKETKQLSGVKSLESVSLAKTCIQPPKDFRFSRDARKIVEVLKKSTVDDTLNFTIPEMDLENEENSFLSPEPVSAFDDTVVPHKNITITPPKVEKDVAENKVEVRSKTVEKERKLTLVVSRSRLQPLKYFSERKLNDQAGGEITRCVKKLPMGEKKAVEKMNGGGDCNAVPTSRIPVFSSKNSKIPVNDRLGRPLATKTTPLKTPSSGKSYKNPKFNHIESPINAYIHNKPTSLVQYVKPEVKKECLAKVWKAQATASATKLQEKTSSRDVRLPFVEYKSATPYKIEKRPESRLPRLAPTVLKLIGSNSPKVLKHEGRFYMKTPRKQNSTENSTIVAETNEVSLVLSHPAQKSHTIK